MPNTLVILATTVILLSPLSALGQRKADPAVLERRSAEAVAAFEAGSFERAAMLFREIVALDPPSALGWHFLGQSLAKTGDATGAKQAYERALELEPSGPIAERTRAEMAKPISLKDPSTIFFPSGITLADRIGQLHQQRASLPKEQLLQEVSSLIRQHGAYPSLVNLQDDLVVQVLDNAPIDNSDNAKASLPRIQSLRAIARDNLDVLVFEAVALHRVNDAAGAKAAYSQWLRASGPDHPFRASVVDSVTALERGQAPKWTPLPAYLPGNRPESLRPEVIRTVLSSPTLTGLPRGRKVTVSYRQYNESPGNPREETLHSYTYEPRGQGLFSLRSNAKTYSSRHKSPGERIDLADIQFFGKVSKLFGVGGELYPLRVGASFWHQARDNSKMMCKVLDALAGSTVHPGFPGTAFVVGCGSSFLSDKDKDLRKLSDATYIRICSNELGMCPFSIYRNDRIAVPDFSKPFYTQNSDSGYKVYFSGFSLTID